MVFARWRQCAAHLIRTSLGPPESKSRTASRSVQLFCRAHKCDRPTDHATRSATVGRIYVHNGFVMVALCNRADHIYFHPVSFFFLLSSSSFFSSPNLSGRRLDVYHTLAHGVALVRISNAGLKCAARGSLQIQDAKNRHLGTITQLCRAISSQLRHVSTIGKKTC